MSFKWSFRQLGGRGESIELSGYLAPFGRPRQKPLMKELIKSRVQTTVYPGSSRPPTRHAFGINWEPMELSGRWMTKTIVNDEVASGATTANELASLWTEFIRDEQLIRMSWGWIVSYTVFIEELELARESEHEIAWRMKLLVDRRDDISSGAPGLRRPAPISDNLFAINTFLEQSKFNNPDSKIFPDLSLDFIDELDFLAGSLNVFSAEMNKLAGKIGDIEKAAFSTIQHFRGAVAGFRTGLLQMREVVLDAKIDLETVETNLQNSTFITKSFLSRSAESDLAWGQYQANFDADSIFIMSQLAEIDRKAELAARADTTKFITALEGDTWESISIRATGGIDAVAKIRSVNGIRYSERPEPGLSYLVP